MSENEKDYSEIYVAGWHLKKEVAITHLITVASIVVSGLWWASSVETRFVHVDGELIRIEEKTDMQMRNITLLFNRIDRKLNKIDDKMDNKADK